MSRKSRTKRIRILGVILLFIIVSVAGVYGYQRLNPGPSCADPLAGATLLKTQLGPPTTVGGITEYELPSPLREPNAPTVAPDGSVWFADQSVPGLAHFYPGNGTLVEYAWPFDYPAPPSTDGICGQKTSTWSLLLWDGQIWATDTSGNQLVSMDPSTGHVSTVKIPTNSSFPYTLTPGPDNTLWFTELYSGQIGYLASNGTVHEFPLPGGIDAEPSQIVFANSTTGYYSDVGISETKGGGVYSFNTGDFSPQLLGGQHLQAPTSITLGSGSLWVALHGSSSVGAYNFTTRTWSYYPTSYVNWSGSAVTTLPYFVSASGSQVWVNEHYGNRIAMIDPANDSLVEFSEASVPVNGNTIGNAVTFAQSDGGAWFTEETGNILGYVDASSSPGFYTTIAGNETVSVPGGSSTVVTLDVHDTTHEGNLSLTFSDSESLISKPSNITFSVPSTSIAPAPGGESSVQVTITSSQSLKPGTYYAILTATDGLTYESSYLKIVVPS